MNQPQTWVEALNISQESLNEWTANAPEDMPLLVWCLEQGHISEDDYFTWAKDRYGLAMLQPGFFDHGLTQEWMNRIKEDGQWQPWFYPVSNWEGVNFVACVEPPSQEEESENRFVLANPQSLRKSWEGSPSLDMPVGLSAEVKPFTLNLDYFPPPPTTPTQIDETSHPAIRSLEPNQQPAVPTGSFSGSPTDDSTIGPPVPAHDDAIFNEFFSRLDGHYTATLVLTVHNNIATPYKWSQKLSVNADDPKREINLSFPTFLRIVAKTLMPYHGYVIDSETHRDLFTSWGVEGLPALVSAVPIKVESSLWGIAVAFNAKESERSDLLALFQDNVEQLTVKLGLATDKAS